MMVRWSGVHQVNAKSQSELDIGGRETCYGLCQSIKDNNNNEEREVKAAQHALIEKTCPDHGFCY